MRRITTGIAVSLLVLALGLALAGCVRVPIDKVPDWLRPTTAEVETTEVGSASADSGGVRLPGSGSHHGTEVLMLGRSVMRGWFDHWGWDGYEPVLREGYALYYAEVESPPGIGRSAAECVAKVPDGTVVVFKLCFVDFEAWSAGDVEARSAENLGYVREIVEAVRGRDVTLIVGNALPRVAGETTPELASLHERYNSELASLASAEPRVHVLDLYGALAPDAVLPKGLAVSPDDSHLNPTAYRVLDEELFGLLDEVAR